MSLRLFFEFVMSPAFVNTVHYWDLSKFWENGWRFQELCLSNKEKLQLWNITRLSLSQGRFWLSDIMCAVGLHRIVDSKQHLKMTPGSCRVPCMTWLVHMTLWCCTCGITQLNSALPYHTGDHSYIWHEKLLQWWSIPNHYRWIQVLWILKTPLVKRYCIEQITVYSWVASFCFNYKPVQRMSFNTKWQSGTQSCLSRVFKGGESTFRTDLITRKRDWRIRRAEIEAFCLKKGDIVDVFIASQCYIRHVHSLATLIGTPC